MSRQSVTLVILVTALFSVAGMLSSMNTAAAQADPYGGLPTEVRAAADAVRSGNLQRILAALRAEGTVVRLLSLAVVGMRLWRPPDKRSRLSSSQTRAVRTHSGTARTRSSPFGAPRLTPARPCSLAAASGPME